MMDRELAKRWLVDAAMDGAVVSTGVAGLDGEVASDDIVVGVVEKGSGISGVFLRGDEAMTCGVSGGRF